MFQIYSHTTLSFLNSTEHGMHPANKCYNDINAQNLF